MNYQREANLIAREFRIMEMEQGEYVNMDRMAVLRRTSTLDMITDREIRMCMIGIGASHEGKYVAREGL